MRHAYTLAVVPLLLLVSCPAVHALTYACQQDNIAYLPVHQMGITGVGSIIGVIDTAYARTDHRTFYTSDNDTTSRVTRLGYYGGSTTYGGHANGVAGIAAGRGKGDTTYLGVAPGAQVWSASTSGEDIDIRQAYLDFTTPDAEGHRARVFAQSLAVGVPDNGYHTGNAFIEWLVENRQTFVCFASGNVHDFISYPGGTFNALTIGGVTQDLQSVSPISGIGPTPDGRSKPDVVAPATKLHVPDHIGVDAWYQNPGAYTSGCPPFGAGVGALIEQVSIDQGMTWDPRVTKVAIMNSATKLAGWTHTNTQPLDNAQGAGLINAFRAYTQYAAGEQAPGNVDPIGWDLNTTGKTQNPQYHITDTAPVGSHITATLTWYRHIVSLDDNLLGHNWAIEQFENFNLFLYRDSDCAIVAQSVSTLDSVEHIYYWVEEADTYTLVVDLTGAGPGSDTYALAWYSDVPEPATVTLVGIATLGAAWLRRRRKPVH